ncbi:bifunctional DNA-formamidopyrimidine glycosylase/DNA-(apurinic or apyrimidinic site) lyase [Aliicoccus persicus]|uniref:DNA-(Apurinic or apyrimidinic site) lyase n=1 Tax=Aliicoccus persicus TaxID=930138 RepID=A0A662Z1J2_9STAP|nr:bifunctional DNA-formamidopyrimidine glycosylase/DNA-(apurinic or apyrimidinic site) lyase [Aliicoccus persicus]SEV86861.1 DNA-(apurinic or apyrimidinic site) lyase [Aliicoccus persicus]
MPELPEVEIVKRELKLHIENAVIEHIKLSEKVITGHKENKRTIVKNDLKSFTEQVTDSKILTVVRRGKYLNFSLQKQNQYFNLVSHLGMSGGYFIVDSPDQIAEENYRTHTHVTFKLSTNQYLVYADIRRFGELRIVPKISEFKPFVEMAPEYFEAHSKDAFIQKITDKRFSGMTIKQAIMDARVIPGVGNIYANEALFKSGIRPTRKAGRISKSRLSDLHAEMVKILDEAIVRGGSTISDYRNTSGGSGTMQDRFVIYQKKICPTCGKNVHTKVINTRNTFYCTECQR